MSSLSLKTQCWGQKKICWKDCQISRSLRLRRTLSRLSRGWCFRRGRIICRKGIFMHWRGIIRNWVRNWRRQREKMRFWKGGLRGLRNRSGKSFWIRIWVEKRWWRWLGRSWWLLRGLKMRWRGISIDLVEKKIIRVLVLRGLSGGLLKEKNCRWAGLKSAIWRRLTQYWSWK